MLNRLFPALALALLCAPALADNYPTYKLQPGQVLTYRGHRAMYEEGATEPRYQIDGLWKIYVVAKLDKDAGWKTITLAGESLRLPGRPDSASKPNSLVIANVHPDGSLDVPGDVVRGDPRKIFARLPQSSKEDVKYNFPSPTGRWFAHADEKRDRPFTIQLAHESNEDVIYQNTSTAKVQFDPARGLLTKWELADAMEYGDKSSTKGVIELTSVETRPVEAVEKLAADAETYQAALKAYEKLMRNLAGDRDAMKQQTDKALDVLKTAVAKIQSPEIKEMLAPDIEVHDRFAFSAIEDAVKIAGIVGKPAPDFDLPVITAAAAPASRNVALKDLKGKIVILDFWYRGCGWCIRAMPQIKELAAEYKDKGVVVLGINVDKDPDDARFVLGRMALNYDSLHADPTFPQKFGVTGFPTMVLLDQQGNIYKFHFGYNPNLKQDLAALIDTLQKK